MKIFFAEIENWEKEYIRENFQFPISPLEARLVKDGNFQFSEEKLNKDTLPEDKSAEIISVFVGSEVDKEVIEAFPNLKLITTRSTGFDHIDYKYASEKGIATAYVPGYGDNTVAEFAFGLLLALSRKIYLGVDRIKETADFSFDGLRGFDLKGKTIGVLGTGRIGQHSIKIAKGFDMNVIAFDAFPNEKLAQELGFKYVSFDELLGQSDVITIHVPYIKRHETSDMRQGGAQGTHHLINKDNISKIKKGAILINTARGAIVETDALVQALNDGILAGAGLDVLEEEGMLADERAMLINGRTDGHDLKTVLENHVLMDMPNVLITPHNAFNTTEALQRILNTDIANIKAFLEKQAPLYEIPT